MDRERDTVIQPLIWLCARTRTKAQENSELVTGMDLWDGWPVNCLRFGRVKFILNFPCPILTCLSLIFYIFQSSGAVDMSIS